MRPGERRLALAAAAAWIGAWSGCAMPGRASLVAGLIAAALAALGGWLSAHSEPWTPLVVALLYGCLGAAATPAPGSVPSAPWDEVEGVVLDLRPGPRGRVIIVGEERGQWEVTVPTTGVGWLDRYDS